MFNPSYFDNSRSGGYGVLEVLGEEKEPAARLFVPLKRTELHGEVAGPVALLRQVQIFSYSSQERAKVLEALYRFPLPGDAAVTGVKVTFGEVEIEASLKEREEAEKEYQKAKEEGRQAALATRESASVFTLHVTGIKPDEEIKVETSFVQLARPENGGFNLRIPLTTAPRYVREDEQDLPQAKGQPLAVLRDPGHRFSLDLHFQGVAEVRSRTHLLDLERGNGALRVRLHAGEVIPDRDCVLYWQSPQEEGKPGFQVLTTSDDKENGYLYFLALVTPPSGAASQETLPREAIVLVDHSGSMSGAKWEASDWAVKRFLLGLSDKDAFNLCLFHNTTLWFAQSPQMAEKEKVAAARKHLENTDSGGTELGLALEQALNQRRTKGNRNRRILIVTDAQVSDEGRILRMVEEEAKRSDRRRISILCIDAAPNSYLALELAERGGGMARFLTSTPSEEDITTALDAIIDEWSQPIIAGLQFQVNAPGMQVARAAISSQEANGESVVDMGDLSRTSATWVVGRVPQQEAGDLNFRLLAGGQVLAESQGTALGEGARGAIKALFGAKKIAALEHLLSSFYGTANLREKLAALGYDPDEVISSPVSQVYPENEQVRMRQAVISLLTSESLEYGLASSATAFVATRKEKGKPVEGTVAVASALPSGWSDDFVTRSAPMGTMAAMSGVSMSMMDGVRNLSVPSFLRRSADVKAPTPAAESEAATPPTKGERAIFSGRPQFANGEAVLYDSNASPATIPAECTMEKLLFSLKAGKKEEIDPGLVLLLYLGDLALPRAQVSLADLASLGGERPLNLRRRQGEVLRLVLEDRNGAWKDRAPEIEVSLRF